MPRRDDEDELTEGAASAPARGARAPRFGTRAHAPMTPPAPDRPDTPDDLRTALGTPDSFGVKLFEITARAPRPRRYHWGGQEQLCSGERRGDAEHGPQGHGSVHRRREAGHEHLQAAGAQAAGAHGAQELSVCRFLL